MNVAVLGASNNKFKYSHMAVTQLAEKGHTVFPVHPKHEEVAGLKVFPDLSSITEPVHTVTVYLNKDRSKVMIDQIIALKPERVILNPGAESEEITEALKDTGILVMEACTLVLLSIKQFDI